MTELTMARHVDALGVGASTLASPTAAEIRRAIRKRDRLLVELARCVVVDRAWHYVLVQASGIWPRAMGARYLAGRDESGVWVIRVPATCLSVGAALVWAVPEEVWTADAVLRQGDVWAIPAPIPAHGDRDLIGALSRRHAWNARTRTLTHPEHAPLVVPWEPARIVASRSLPMTRQWQRGAD